MPAPITSHHRALKAAAPVFAGLVLLGACSKKDDTTSTTPTTAASSSSGGGSTTAKPTDKTTTTEGGSTGTTSKTSGSTPGTVKAGNTLGDINVWWTGFKLTLGTITLDKDAETLDIATQVENLGPDNTPIYGDMSLEADGTVLTTGSWVENPSVLAGSKAKDIIRFSVKDTYDPKKTTLVIGKGTQQQVRVPMTGVGKLINLQPQPQEFKGEIKVGLLSFDVKKTEVRYDHIANHDEAAKDRAFLVMYGTATNTSATESLYIDPSKFEIALPDGTKAATETYLGETGLEATNKDDKTAIYFEIPAPYAGDYTITFKGALGTESAEASVTQKIAVKVGETDSGSSTTTAKK